MSGKAHTNSHNSSIVESQKPWAKDISDAQWEIAVGLRCPACRERNDRCECEEQQA